MRRRVCRLLTFTANVDGLARYRGHRFGFPSFLLQNALICACERQNCDARPPSITADILPSQRGGQHGG